MQCFVNRDDANSDYLLRTGGYINGCRNPVLSWLRIVCLLVLLVAPVLTAQERAGAEGQLVTCDPSDSNKLRVKFASETPTQNEKAVAHAWCNVIHAPNFRYFPNSTPPFRWSDAHGVGLLTGEDLAFAWAVRSFYLNYRPGRLEVELHASHDLKPHHFTISSSYYVQASDSSYSPAARTLAYAEMSGDTVVLTSALTVAINQSTRSFETKHVTFISLGGASIDTVAAQRADSFADAIRRRTTGVQRSILKPRYFITPLDVAAANATLGIHLPVDTVVGFVSRGTADAAPFLWAGSIGVSELYYHELVHLALVARSSRLDERIEEAVAHAFGGTMRRSFNQRVCSSLADLLSRKKSSTVSQLLLRPEAYEDTDAEFIRVTSLIIRFVDESSQEPRLSRVLDALTPQPTYDTLLRVAAQQLGITRKELLEALDRSYGQEGMRQRCQQSS